MNWLIGLTAGVFASIWLTIVFSISGSEQSDQNGSSNFAIVISLVLAGMFFIFDQELRPFHNPYQPSFSIGMAITAMVLAKKSTHPTP